MDLETYHDALPAPITVIGLQVAPIRASMSPTSTMPRVASSPAIAASLAVPLLSQHVRELVEHELAGVVRRVIDAVGVAAARVARAVATRMAVLKLNICKGICFGVVD